MNDTPRSRKSERQQIYGLVPGEKLLCLEYDPDDPDCSGPVEYRMPLSGSGRSFPRCDKHWAVRLDVQEEINRKYPTNQPSDFDPAYAGERWDED